MSKIGTWDFLLSLLPITAPLALAFGVTLALGLYLAETCGVQRKAPGLRVVALLTGYVALWLIPDLGALGLFHGPSSIKFWGSLLWCATLWVGLFHLPKLARWTEVKQRPKLWAVFHSFTTATVVFFVVWQIMAKLTLHPMAQVYYFGFLLSVAAVSMAAIGLCQVFLRAEQHPGKRASVQGLVIILALGIFTPAAILWGSEYAAPSSRLTGGFFWGSDDVISVRIEHFEGLHRTPHGSTFKLIELNTGKVLESRLLKTTSDNFFLESPLKDDIWRVRTDIKTTGPGQSERSYSVYKVGGTEVVPLGTGVATFSNSYESGFAYSQDEHILWFNEGEITDLGAGNFIDWWSEDSKEVIVSKLSQEETHFEYWRVRLDSELERQLVYKRPRLRNYEFRGFSPDGQWVLDTKPLPGADPDAQNVQRSFVAINLQTGSRLDVCKSKLRSAAAFSPDSSQVLALSNDDLILISLRGGETQKLSSPVPRDKVRYLSGRSDGWVLGSEEEQYRCAFGTQDWQLVSDDFIEDSPSGELRLYHSRETEQFYVVNKLGEEVLRLRLEDII